VVIQVAQRRAFIQKSQRNIALPPSGTAIAAKKNQFPSSAIEENFSESRGSSRSIELTWSDSCVC
jgi:hypothetical protein